MELTQEQREQKIRDQYESLNRWQDKVRAIEQTMDDCDNQGLLIQVIQSMFEHRTKEGKQELRNEIQAVLDKF